MRHTPSSLLIAAWTMAACGPGQSGTTEDTGSVAGTSGTASSTGTGGETTAEVPTTGPDPATGSTGDGAGTSTTEPGGSGLPDACTAQCQRLLECVPESAGPLDECVAGCLQAFQGVPLCSEPAAALMLCLSTLSCEQLIAFYEDDVLDPCLEQFAALENACGPGCLMSGLSGPDGCSLARVCGAVTQDYQCSGETCTCVENDAPGAACASEGFCALAGDAQAAAANACCGWDWP